MSEDRSVLSRPARAADQVLQYGPHRDHLVEVRFAAAAQDPRPLLVLVHGGFWRPQYDRTHTGPLAEALAAAGWTVATIEYRRTPQAPDLTVQDIRLAIATVPALVAGHSGKALLIGHSAGGHLVLWAASSCDAAALHGVLALAPVADLRLADQRGLGEHAVRAFLGAEPQHRADLDPACMSAPQVPTVVLHGEVDAIVPLAISESYHARHPGPRLVRLAGAGHFAVIDPQTPAWGTVLACLEWLRNR